jgi:hypothetical protein
VLDKDMNIVVQTFNINEMLKFYSRSFLNATESEYFSAICQYDIISCNRDVLMLFEEGDFAANKEDKCYLKEAACLNDILSLMLKDPEQHKQSCFEVY